jgi:FAD/FMN-containing dehydrogenase
VEDARSYDQLSELLNGRVILPDDSDYDDARMVWNAMFDRRPSAIAQCEDATDVANAVKFANENGLPFSVRAGGHGASGDCLQDGILAIDLTRMTRVVVDPVTQRATVQAGCLLGTMDAELQKFGLAVPSGTVPDTGVSGLTLGGGVGWTMRKFGATIDHLVSVSAVDVEGDVVHASESVNAELFWGLRGGGGNFVIVTDYEFQAVELGPTVLSGPIMFTSDHGDILRFWRDFMLRAPNELGSTISLLRTPAGFPAEDAGPLLTVINVAYVGDLEVGQQVILPLQERFRPAMNLVRQNSYLALQAFLARGLPHRARAYEKGGLLPALSDVLIDDLVELAETAPVAIDGQPDTTSVAISALGGIFTTNADSRTSMPRDDSQFIWLSMSLWMDEGRDDEWIDYPRRLSKLVDQYSDGRIYLNQDSSERGERVRQAFGEERYNRLVSLKDTWDPQNVLCYNKNILPSASQALSTHD